MSRPASIQWAANAGSAVKNPVASGTRAHNGESRRGQGTPNSSASPAASGRLVPETAEASTTASSPSSRSSRPRLSAMAVLKCVSAKSEPARSIRLSSTNQARHNVSWAARRRRAVTRSGWR